MKVTSLYYLVQFFLEVHQAVGVYVARVHFDGQVVPLQKSERVLFLLQLVSALAHFCDSQFL